MNLLEYTAAAYQYGPFFFAILFIMVVTRWAHKKYKDAYTDTNAPVKVQQTYRAVFIIAFTFSCTLVIVAIGFYWKNPPMVHIFEGTIDNLQGYETVTSGDLYLKRTYKE